MDINFRTLRADEIEVRVQSVKNDKANMLLYIDSRAVTKLLDETVGCMNWQTEFYEVNGQTMGKLGIWDEDKKMWIWKSDTGSESNIEAEKGLISDVYKRMLVRWGVVELYFSPKILLNDDKYGNTGYKVSEIEYDNERRIIKLVIVNRFNKEAFRWEKGQEYKEYPQRAVATQTPQTQTQDALDFVVETDMDKLKTFYNENKNKTEFDTKMFTSFKDYYKKKLEGGKWNGMFDPATLWIRWKERAAQAA